MRCEKMQHPGSVGSCQPSEKGLAGALARAVISATCGSAEFLYPAPWPDLKEKWKKLVAGLFTLTYNSYENYKRIGLYDDSFNRIST